MTLHPGEVRLYHAPAQVDIELPTEVVDHYRVFPDPDISDAFRLDIACNGIKSPVRVYTNGIMGVLTDGHHRLVAAKDLDLERMPVHVIPNWLQKTYVDYDLPRLERRLIRWLKDNLDFIHQGHQTRRIKANKMVIRVFCSCGADWRETPLNSENTLEAHLKLL